MKIRFFIFSLAYIALFASCREKTKNTYAIRDFSKTLQPYLTTVVSQGIVGFDPATKFIAKHATDKELKQLSKSEHPVLRALAFREMLNRPTFDHFDLMMNNLDDTAIVATDAGEWGLWYFRVSDDMLMNGKWKDTAAKTKTIEEIILKHNFLTCAYLRAGWMGTNEKFYPSIKEMVQRQRGFFDTDEQKAYAVYALAAYRKPEDIPLIKENLRMSISRAGKTPFDLIANFPNDAYLEVLEDFYPRQFYRSLCNDMFRNPDLAEYFIKSIALYKNEQSEKILDSILNRKPFLPCSRDSNYLKDQLARAIWDNPCPAYTKLRKQVEGRIADLDDPKHTIPLSNDTHYELPKDTAKEPVEWH